MITPDVLVEVFETILNNSGLDFEKTLYKGYDTVFEVNGDENAFLNVYQSLYLATPLCYNVEEFDGFEFKVFDKGYEVINVRKK